MMPARDTVGGEAFLKFSTWSAQMERLCDEPFMSQLGRIKHLHLVDLLVYVSC